MGKNGAKMGIMSSISPVKNGGKNGENGKNFISGHEELNSFERAPFFMFHSYLYLYLLFLQAPIDIKTNIEKMKGSTKALAPPWSDQATQKQTEY